MQPSFGFNGHDDILRWRGALRASGPPRLWTRRKPVGQLVKSMISGRTRDAVSLAAYDRLVARYRSPRRVARAPRREIARCIRDVTFAGDKAGYLVQTLRGIEAERGGFALDFLGEAPLAEALAWLERFPGVGRKVAAATLNASTLNRPVFIVDSHVLRIFRRLGFAGAHAEAAAVSEAVTGAMSEWSGDEFLDFHVLMKRLGQTRCRPDRADCAGCPLAGDCRAG
ncbi:endonuclease III [Sphingomonas sp. LB-2]|uniref:endonuclease III domain-containing protein n=1 Tax=Sphingomonas caeni TaxID=2984949 RepID=UPI002232BCB7|nr:endonuclease III [Sphingomonas caeni]MCW3846625.1 endonuclease III [Sphingomonas caeni]